MKHERKKSRREFLTGGQFGRTDDSSPPVDDAMQEKRAGHPDRSADYLEHFSKNAMACEFELFFNMGQFSGSGSAALKAFALIDELEEQLSVYRTSSEITVLNDLAAREWVSVEVGLFNLLMRGTEISTWTDGAFDMTSSELSRVWGFTRREGQVPTPEAIEAALTQVGYERLQFDSDTAKVRFQEGGLQINLGGIGKGYALDRAADLLTEQGISDFVLHGGQSSVVARGRETCRLPADENGWTIGLSHPLMPDNRLAEIYLHDAALATSGTGRQGFYYQGQRYGHIIDPRTGYPSDHCLSSTVIAESAADCDALATAFFVMQPEEVARFCQDHREYKSLLVLPGKSPGSIHIESFNMGPQEWRRLDRKSDDTKSDDTVGL